MRNTEIKFEIIETIGVIGHASNGWTKELNIVAWNDWPAKYDLRSWSPDRSKFTKGFTFNEPEAIELMKLLQEHVVDPENVAEEAESDMLKNLLMDNYFNESEDDEDEGEE